MTFRLAHYAKWPLAGIILLAVALRSWDIEFGLPRLYHPDEPLNVQIAQHIFKSGDLNPHFFDYPSLFFYIHALAYLPFFLVSKIVGALNTPQDIPEPVILALGLGTTTMPATFLLGRLVTLLFGVGVVVVTYLIGKELLDSRAIGLLAALAVAVSPTTVINSRIITPDMMTTFFALLALLGAGRIMQDGAKRHYALTAIAAGLAASTKYNGALVILLLVVAHLFYYEKKGFKDGKLYIAIGVTVLTFLLTTPFALLDVGNFLSDVRHEAQHYSTGHMGMEGDTTGWYLTYFWSVEGVICLLAVMEIVRGIVLRQKNILLISAFPLVYIVAISTLTVRNDRTALLLLPFLFLLGWSFLSYLVSLKDRLPLGTRYASAFLLGGLALFSLGFSLFQTVSLTMARQHGVESREEAMIWIARNLPPGSHIAAESYGPYIDPARFSVQDFTRLADHTADWYPANGYDYLIFSKGMFGRFYSDIPRYAGDVAQYEHLFRSFETVHAVPDTAYEIRVYKVRR